MSTARGVALLRVMEMYYPEATRLSSDPYAKSFVNPLIVQFTGSGLLRALPGRSGSSR